MMQSRFVLVAALLTLSALAVSGQSVCSSGEKPVLSNVAGARYAPGAQEVQFFGEKFVNKDNVRVQMYDAGSNLYQTQELPGAKYFEVGMGEHVEGSVVTVPRGITAASTTTVTMKLVAWDGAASYAAAAGDPDCVSNTLSIPLDVDAVSETDAQIYTSAPDSFGVVDGSVTAVQHYDVSGGRTCTLTISCHDECSGQLKKVSEITQEFSNLQEVQFAVQESDIDRKCPGSNICDFKCDDGSYSNPSEYKTGCESVNDPKCRGESSGKRPRQVMRNHVAACELFVDNFDSPKSGYYGNRRQLKDQMMLRKRCDEPDSGSGSVLPEETPDPVTGHGGVSSTGSSFDFTSGTNVYTDPINSLPESPGNPYLPGQWNIPGFEDTYDDAASEDCDGLMAGTNHAEIHYGTSVAPHVSASAANYATIRSTFAMDTIEGYSNGELLQDCSTIFEAAGPGFTYSNNREYLDSFSMIVDGGAMRLSSSYVVSLFMYSRPSPNAYFELRPFLLDLLKAGSEPITPERVVVVEAPNTHGYNNMATQGRFRVDLYFGNQNFKSSPLSSVFISSGMDALTICDADAWFQTQGDSATDVYEAKREHRRRIIEKLRNPDPSRMRPEALRTVRPHGRGVTAEFPNKLDARAYCTFRRQHREAAHAMELDFTDKKMWRWDSDKGSSGVTYTTKSRFPTG